MHHANHNTQTYNTQYIIHITTYTQPYAPYAIHNTQHIIHNTQYNTIQITHYMIHKSYKLPINTQYATHSAYHAMDNAK